MSKYDRINKRVDIMLENGLLEEAKKIYDTLYKKYSSKYEGYELDMIIKQKMYQKGYDISEINV